MSYIDSVKLPDNSEYSIKAISSASDVTYDNTSSGLAATDVQDAVDEVNGAMQYLYNNTGGKNLLPYPYPDTTFVQDGITYTDNGDGTITLTGTASATSWFTLLLNKTIKQGSYILNGCPAGGSFDSGYFIYINTLNIYDEGNGDSFTLANDTSCNITIVVRQGTVISSPITFKPMIRDASIFDDTYVPYAMTNRELTEKFHDPVLLGSVSSSSLSNVAISPALSNFGELLIQAENGNGGVFLSARIPMSIFKQKNSAYNPIVLYFNDGGGNKRSLCHYDSDSAVKALIDGGYTLKFYGMN